MTKSHPIWPWSVPLTVHDVPAEGQQLRLEADAATRDAVAKLAGVTEIPRLEADFTAVPHRDGLHVTGQVSATVGQTCVVTLEPMQSEVNEPIDLLYLRNLAQAAEGGSDTEEEPGRIGDERIETLHDDIVDLGAAATEFLMLGIDPYPRKPGAAFASPPSDRVESSPFAALAALKKAPRKNHG